MKGAGNGGAPLTVVFGRGAVSDAAELLEALATEAAARGMAVTRAAGYPQDETGTFLFAPGDIFGIPGEATPSPRQLARSIAVCEAAPGGALDPAYLHARRSAAMIGTDAEGVALMRRHGIEATLVDPATTEAWREAGEDDDRQVDIACLDARNVDADRLLASFGPVLWQRRCILLGAPEAPVAATEEEPVPPLARGEARRRLLASTRVLVTGVGDESEAVLQIRAIQAALNGAVVVAPHGCDLTPLVPGTDFAVADPRNLALVADGLLREPERMDALRRCSRERLKWWDAGWAPVIDWIAAQTERIAAGASGHRTARAGAGVQASLNRVRDRAREALRPPPNPRRVAQKREALAAIAQRRSAAGGSGEPSEVFRSDAYEAAQPRVTVCIPLFEHADAVLRALETVAASEYGGYEVLVLDDASTQPSVPRVREFLEQHPWLPATVLTRDANRGLGPGRNDMAQRARGELLFMLDADNEIYPTALGRLSQALEEDPGAAFAYSLIETHTDGRPRALLSALPWQPRRLRLGNYVDAMSMIRRDALLDAGGYTDDLALHGWEDFDLWCRFAARGLRGRLVPEILCRYSFAEESMIATTNLDSSEAWATLRERYPAVLGGAPQPVFPPPPPDVGV